MALALERYGAIVIDRPRDVVALALAHEVGPMAYTMHSGDFGPSSDRMAPVANGIGAKLARLARRLTDALAARRQREVNREIARFLARSGGRITDSVEREINAESFGISLEPAAIAASSSVKRNLSLQGSTPMPPAPLYHRFVEPAPHAQLNEIAFDPGHSEFRTLRAKRRQDIRLALRPARSSDGDALQSYVRRLSPQSRYNRFLGAVSELPASELARALAANGRDTLTLLLTSTAEDHETVVGEARVALSCAKRAGEFSMSIADDWRHLGLGSALLQEI